MEMSAAGPSTGSGTAPGRRSGRDGGDGEGKDGERKDGEGWRWSRGDGVAARRALRQAQGPRPRPGEKKKI